MGLAARVKDPLPDRHPALVRRLSRYTARVDGCLLVLCVAVAPRIRLVVYAGRGALDLLHDRLLAEGLRFAV
jgi:hypothetical protein